MSQALYQKYRPQSFDQVIGQDEAVKYFQSIVKKSGTDIINHAYLLTGGRGIGKTTIARIFAKSLGTGDIDVIELDTASNRGIDEIKDLREATLARPLESKYKVFILDEVHMITTAGANALLKTLEEPTPWTIFVLCTTDPDKLISTILSRCQIVKLQSPATSDILQLLSHINKQEKLGVDTQYIESIANTHTSYRDAIGALERASYVDKEHMLSHMGIGYADISIELIELILSKDIKSIFMKLDELSSQHKDVDYHKLYTNIINNYRAALLKRVGAAHTIDNTHIQGRIDDIINKHKDIIRSDILKSLLDNEYIWSYRSIDQRGKFELIIINII